MQSKQQRTGIQFRTLASGAAFSIGLAVVASVLAFPRFGWSDVIESAAWALGNALWFVGPLTAVVLLLLLVNPTTYPSR